MWGKPVTSEVICSEVKPPDVWLGKMPEQKIECLMSEYKSQEWFAYLIGIQEEDIVITDICVPPHKSVSGGSAEAKPFNAPKDCVGVIHSHHSMGAFHSGTDHDYVDRNYPVSTTVAHGKNGGLEYDTVGYVKTPCGKHTVVKCKLMFTPPKLLFDKEKFLEEAKANIDMGRNLVNVYYLPDPFHQNSDYFPSGNYVKSKPFNYLNPKSARRFFKGSNHSKKLLG